MISLCGQRICGHNNTSNSSGPLRHRLSIPRSALILERRRDGKEGRTRADEVRGIAEGERIRVVRSEERNDIATGCRLPDIRYAAVVVDRDRDRRVAVIIPWPGKAIDQAVYLRAVAAEYGQAVATSLLLLPRDTILLTSQGKPDREAIRALGRADGTSSTVAKTTTAC
jgi:hypothetical protein